MSGPTTQVINLLLSYALLGGVCVPDSVKQQQHGTSCCSVGGADRHWRFQGGIPLVLVLSRCIFCLFNSMAVEITVSVC